MNDYTGKLKVLVVENDNIIAMNIQDWLEKFGYTVPAKASTGPDAIEKAIYIRPDVIVMDIKLKGEMDGIEAAGFIKDKTGIPIVFLTAYSDYSESDVLKRAKEAVPYGYMLKPFTDRDLHIVIEMAIYRRKMEVKLRETEHALRQSDKMASIGQLAAGVAHEINNPVNSTIALAQLIVKISESGSETEELAKDIVYDDCYHNQMTSLYSESAITYCIGQYKDCAMFKMHSRRIDKWFRVTLDKNRCEIRNKTLIMLKGKYKN